MMIERRYKMPKVIKVKLHDIKVQQGSAYKSRLKVDYGVPYLRGSVDTSAQNVARRDGLTANKKNERAKKEAQKWNEKP